MNLLPAGWQKIVAPHLGSWAFPENDPLWPCTLAINRTDGAGWVRSVESEVWDGANPEQLSPGLRSRLAFAKSLGRNVIFVVSQNTQLVNGLGLGLYDGNQSAWIAACVKHLDAVMRDSAASCIKGWEVMNEPQWGDGSDATHLPSPVPYTNEGLVANTLKYCTALYNLTLAVKELRDRKYPSIKLASSSDTIWEWGRLLHSPHRMHQQIGTYDLCDIVSLHFYAPKEYSADAPMTYAGNMDLVTVIRECWQEQLAKGKPLYITEMGAVRNPSRLFKRVLLARAAGVEVIHGYGWNSGETSLGLWEEGQDGVWVPTESYQAAMMALWWTAGGTCLVAHDTNGNLHRSVWRTRSSKLIEFLWATEGTTASITGAAYSRSNTYDIFASPLSPFPITQEPVVVVDGKLVGGLIGGSYLEATP